jgi:uncharacterized protein (DUF2126 family)
LAFRRIGCGLRIARSARGNLAMLIDYDGGGWYSAPWSLSKDLRVLVEAEGPSGLRLPLDRLPPSIPRRALCIEKKGEAVGLFVPPLLQKPFLELLAAVEGAASQTGIASLAFEGYTPVDEEGLWTVLGLTADPGVLEINFRPAPGRAEYAHARSRL